MRKLMNKIDRFCYTHPRFGIPNLMLIIVIGNAAVWLLTKRPLVLFFILHTKKPPWFSPGRLPSVR